MVSTVEIRFRQRSLPLDIDFRRHGFSDWQGSSLVGLPGRAQVFFTLATRRRLPVDLRRVTLGTDRVDGVRGIGGDLRAGIDGLDGSIWLLAMYRLHELRAEPLELLHTYRVPKYGWGLLPMFRGTRLALTRLDQKRVPIFSLQSRSIERTIPMPYPQLAIDGFNESTLFSFWDERARSFDEQLQPRGKARDLPIGVTPVTSGGAIHFVRGERRIFDRLSPPDPRITWVYPLERVQVFAPGIWDVLAEGAHIPRLEALLGYDDAGRLIGRSADEIILLHAGGLTELARHACGSRINSAAQASASGVVVQVGSNQGDELQLIEWS